MFSLDDIGGGKRVGGTLLTLLVVLFLFMTVNLTMSIIELSDFDKLDKILANVGKEQAQCNKWIEQSKKVYVNITKEKDHAEKYGIYQAEFKNFDSSKSSKIELGNFMKKFIVDKTNKVDLIWSFENFKLIRQENKDGKWSFGFRSALDYNNKVINFKFNNSKFTAERVKVVGIGKKAVKKK